jgi:ribosomal protein S18 acetylase RimI-like enzyme
MILSGHDSVHQAVVALRIRRLRAPGEARLCADLMAGSEPWITLRWTRGQALKLLRNTAKDVYVATVDRAVVGFVILHLGGPLNGYLQTVGVMPEWRRRGIGRKLIAFAEARIARVSPNVFLCVSSFNTGARRLYARLGYKRVGELKDYLVRGHSEILLRKTHGPLGEFRSD